MTTTPQPEFHLDAERLNAFAEGALSAPERALCLQHLAECSRCREIAFLAGASVPLEEPALTPVRRFSFTGWPVLSLGAATLAAIVIAVMHHPHENVPTAHVQIATESTAPPSPTAMTEAPMSRATTTEPRARAVPKPSPAQKAPPKPEAPTLDNLQISNASAMDSAAASAQPAAAPQQLADVGKTLHGVSVSPAPPARPSQAQVAGAAKEAPSLALRTYNAESPLRAPDGFAQIAGAITDSSGAAVPHAKVTLDQPSGSTHRETLTDSAGRFTISSVQPGKYRLQISSPGFTTQVREIELGTSQLASVDSQLAVGTASETVAVEAAAPLVNTESASVQSALPGKQPLQTSVSSGSRTLALDSSGRLLLSKNATKHWKAIHGPWKKSAVTDLSLTPDQLFKVTTAQGSWLSGDGEHWHPAN